MTLRVPLQLLFALTAVALPRAAQEGGGDPLAPALDPKAEMIRLFGKVENRLREIDRLLADAGAGDRRALEKVGPSGIDELLKQSRESSAQAVEDIDRILDLAQQMSKQQSPSSSSGSGEPQQQPGGGQSGSDPLGGQAGNSTQRENTPAGPEEKGERPGEKPGGEQPQGAAGQKPEKKPGPDGTPKDTQASASDPRNRQSGPPPEGARESGSQGAGAERWGDLPVHARDVFRNEGGRDMPVRYRDWIDEYYRRMNREGP